MEDPLNVYPAGQLASSVVPVEGKHSLQKVMFSYAVPSLCLPQSWVFVSLPEPIGTAFNFGPNLFVVPSGGLSLPLQGNGPSHLWYW